MRNLTNVFPVVVALCLYTGHAPAIAQEAADREDATNSLYYPPLPDLPRIQYLASFSFASDIEVKEEKKKREGER